MAASEPRPVLLSGRWLRRTAAALTAVLALAGGGRAAAQPAGPTPGTPARIAWFGRPYILAMQDFLPAPRPAAPGAGPLALEPPGPDELFRAESECAFLQRLAGTGGPDGGKAILPPEAPPRPAVVPARAVSSLLATYAPTGVCHGPVYFGEPSPTFQPLRTIGGFYLRTALLPVALVLQPPWSVVCDTVAPPPTAAPGCFASPE